MRLHLSVMHGDNFDLTAWLYEDVMRSSDTVQPVSFGFQHLLHFRESHFTGHDESIAYDSINGKRALHIFKWVDYYPFTRMLAAVFLRSVSMEIVLLGTAAAEGWPAAYCDCAVCELARQRGGKNIRMRSGALIDGDLKIDHSPDTVAHMMRLGPGRSLAKVRTILITHEHPDHLFANELKRTVNLPRDMPPQPAIAIYGNRRVLNKITEAFPAPEKFRLDLQPPLEPLKELTLPDGTRVLPLPATHCEDALLLRIERNGKSLFYGHDSGTYTTETLDALGKAGPLDVALLDCTHTIQEDVDCRHHMNIPTLLRMAEELRARGAIVRGRTRVIATHFAPHSGAKSHEELVRLLEPHGVEVAFDGMILNIK